MANGYESGWSWGFGNALLGGVATAIAGAPTKPFVGLLVGVAVAAIDVAAFSKNFTAKQRATVFACVVAGSVAVYGLLKVL